jgi:hypothetical protein
MTSRNIKILPTQVEIWPEDPNSFTPSPALLRARVTATIALADVVGPGSDEMSITVTLARETGQSDHRQLAEIAELSAAETLQAIATALRKKAAG